MSTSLSTFEADAPAREIVSALKKDGGIVVRNLVAEDLMDEVYAEILLVRGDLGGVRNDAQPLDAPVGGLATARSRRGFRASCRRHQFSRI